MRVDVSLFLYSVTYSSFIIKLPCKFKQTKVLRTINNAVICSA